MLRVMVVVEGGLRRGKVFVVLDGVVVGLGRGRPRVSW